jgi:predicted DNA-binding transcriptional regulator YafY
MGKRSAAATPAGIMLAFHECTRWRQADLARKLEVTTDTLVRALRVLSDEGMPLIRDDSDKPHVWWRVPKSWAPSGILFAREQTPALLRALARSPRTRERDALLAHAARSARTADEAGALETPAFSIMEEEWLSVFEDAAKRGLTLGMRYYSTNAGKIEWRHVSVQRVVTGPPSRFIAVCHRSGTLKWFRVENVSHARPDADVPYRRHGQESVRAFHRESVDGFHGAGAPVDCAFVVREPEARWVRVNLLAGMSVDPDEPISDGVRVRCSTSGVLRVARFVVSLGGAARVETQELAACVRDMAMGVLEGVEVDSGHGHGRAKRLEVRRARG